MCHLYSVNIYIWTSHLDAPCSQGRERQWRQIPPWVSALQKQNTKTQPIPAVVIHLPSPLIFAILRFTGKNYKTYPGDFHAVLDAIFRVL